LEITAVLFTVGWGVGNRRILNAVGGNMSLILIVAGIVLLGAFFTSLLHNHCEWWWWVFIPLLAGIFALGAGVVGLIV
jgi:hypothetical protein